MVAKKKSKTVETKATTARAKAAAKKKAKQDGTYKTEDEDEDAYKAPSKMMSAPRPPPRKHGTLCPMWQEIPYGQHHLLYLYLP